MTIRKQRETQNLYTGTTDKLTFPLTRDLSHTLGDGRGETLMSQAPQKDALLAYSLRSLRSYNEPIIKVRRPRDNAVQNFTASELAGARVEDFVVGQNVLDLYNKAAYFTGDSSENYFNTSITLSGAFSISFDVVFTAGAFHTNDTRIFQDTLGQDLLTFTANDTCKFKVGSGVKSFSTLSTPLELYRKHSIIFARDGSGNYTLTVDGSAVATKSGSDTDDFTINRMGFRTTGALLNININSGQHIFAGDGAEESNWVDTGSGTTANATKVGTLSAFTGQGIHGYVDTWYNQSTYVNGKNLIQPSTALQPFILKDGAYLDAVEAPVNTATTGIEANAKVHMIVADSSDVATTFDNAELPANTTKLAIVVVGENITSQGNGNDKGTLFGAARGVANYDGGQFGMLVESNNKLQIFNSTGGANVNDFQRVFLDTTGANAYQTNKVILVAGGIGATGIVASNSQSTQSAFVRQGSAAPDSTGVTINLSADSATDSDRHRYRLFAPCSDNAFRANNHAFGKVREVLLLAGDGAQNVLQVQADINAYYKYF